MRNLCIVLVCATIFASNAFSRDNNFILVIDPGHGGKDGGATRDKYKEKDINLAVALAFGKLVEQNMPDVDVVYTRKNDVAVALDERAKLANKVKADIFISIHTNSTSPKTTSAKGAETYILGLSNSAASLAVAKRENSVVKYEENYVEKYEGFDPDSPASYIIFEFMTNQHLNQSLALANLVQKKFKQTANRYDRGARQGALMVLRESSMPSILVELGFINNPTEAKYLASATGQKELALSIYQAFREYKDSYNLRDSKSYAESKSDYRQQSESSSQSKTKAEYTIQYLYTQKKQANNSSLFKGVIPTSVKVENGYKYRVGETSNYNEILELYRTVRMKFPDAFIIRIDEEGDNYDGDSDTLPKYKEAGHDISGVQLLDTSNKESNKQKQSSGQVEYRVQFLFSKKLLNPNDSQLKGLPDVSYYKDGTGYKYTAGSSTSVDEIIKVQREVRKKYKDAFVIKFKDGKRM